MPLKGYKQTEEHKKRDGRSLIKHYCIDCGKELLNYKAKRCHSCANKITTKENWQNPEYRKNKSGKNCNWYINGECLEKHYCVDCGKELKEHRAKRCPSCDKKGERNPIYKDGRTLKRYYCVDCGREISIGAERCRFCSNKGENNPFYKDGKSFEKYYCVDCGKELSVGAERCSNCATKEVANRPEMKKLHNEIMKKIAKQNWQDGKMDGVFMSPTKPEKEIMKVLEKLELDYIFQFRPEGYSRVYDFHIQNMNLLIEFDGVYWHSLKKSKLSDIKKTEYAKNNGYNLLRFNENNLDDFESSILEKIKKEENYAKT